MNFDRVTIPAASPESLGVWYRERFGGGSGTEGSGVQLGETTLRFAESADPPPAHLAFRLGLPADRAVDWLADRVTVLPIDGEPSRRFEFLDATAIYFDDLEGNVLEGLCYDGDPRQRTDSGVGGVTEVGLPAEEPLALVEWLETTVGLSAWGSPSETFAWVGDRHARFVVIPTDREWYPTHRTAGLAPISVTVVADTADQGQYQHPTLPYDVVVTHDN